MDLPLQSLFNTVVINQQAMMGAMKYIREEVDIAVVREYLIDKIFENGFRLIVSDGAEAIPVTYDQLQLKTLLIKAFDHMLVYGFTLFQGDGEKEYNRLIVPDMDRGIFYRVQENGNTTIKYIDGAFGIQYSDTPVFLWPGMAPDRYGFLCTPIYQLYIRYMEIRELIVNMKHTDWNRSHPVLVTQPVGGARSLDAMTESEILTVDRPEPDLMERLRMKRTRLGFEDIRMRSELAAGSSTSGIVSVFDRLSGGESDVRYPRIWDMGEYRIGEGTQLVNPIQPDFNPNLITFINDYRRMISVRLGVPEWVFHPQQMRYKIDEEKRYAEIDSVINKCRNNLEIFFNYANAEINRDIENNIIGGLFSEGIVGDFVVEDLAKEKFRVRLEFVREKHVSTDSAVRAFELGCISRDELNDIVRINMGLSILSSAEKKKLEKSAPSESIDKDTRKKKTITKDEDSSSSSSSSSEETEKEEEEEKEKEKKKKKKTNKKKKKKDVSKKDESRKDGAETTKPSDKKRGKKKIAAEKSKEPEGGDGGRKRKRETKGEEIRESKKRKKTSE